MELTQSMFLIVFHLTIKTVFTTKVFYAIRVDYYLGHVKFKIQLQVVKH